MNEEYPDQGIEGQDQDLDAERTRAAAMPDGGELSRAAEPPPENPRESTLRKEVSRLKRLLAEKTLEVDFFKGALQEVAARRQKHGITGGKASTTKSGE